ncbi:NaCP60E [Symbiodinium microadriaticum]|nr:NaCP60E [Symbiodinium microadriaticum]CAE7949397.1 NaCP60E [Symbiodinium sp. KB8]
MEISAAAKLYHLAGQRRAERCLVGFTPQSSQPPLANSGNLGFAGLKTTIKHIESYVDTQYRQRVHEVLADEPQVVKCQPMQSEWQLTWRGSLASRGGGALSSVSCACAELVFRRPWLDCCPVVIFPTQKRVRMESSIRGSLGSCASVGDSILKQLAGLEQSLSSNLAGLRQIRATVAAMEGKPESQSQRVSATPAAVCEGTQEQRSTLLETKWSQAQCEHWAAWTESHVWEGKIPGELSNECLLPESCPPRKRAVTFTAISPMQETNRARDRHTLATHRLSVLNAISEAKSVPAPREPSKKSVFFDASTLKKKLKEDLCKETYNVSDYYRNEGFCQRVARSRVFELITFVILASNAIWTGVEIEVNDAPVILQAHAAVILIESFFVLYFTLEIGLRFGAFKRTCDACRDGWFAFDTVLVILMWFETWLLSLVQIVFGDISNSSSFRLIRLLRLTRMARMARLLRSVPELLIIVRAIAIALRSVFFLMVLLLGLVYVFALLFSQLFDGKNQPPGTLAHKSFGSLPQAMNTLLMAGALPDQSSLVEDAGAVHFLLYPLMLLYMLLASLTVMNMLVGILCEVVSVVSAVEKEEILLKSVKTHLKQLLLDAEADEDGDGSISRREFDKMLTNPTCVRTLNEVGVDVFALVDLADFIFEQKDHLDFAAFMDAVLQLRGSNTATVKDIVDLQKLIVNHFKVMEDVIAELAGKSPATKLRDHAEKDPTRPLEMEVFGTNATKIVIRSIAAQAALVSDQSTRLAGRLVLAVRRSNCSEDAGDRRGLEFRVHAVQGLPPACKSEIRVARETNVGKLAGAIAQRIREDAVALVRGAGAVALKHQLSAVAIASGYLEERDELGGYELVALPRYEDLVDPSGGRGQMWTEFALTVYRLPVS